jgi:glycosyltransferase involved in cell wall biosynthesis
VRIVAIAPGDPFAPATFSGISAALLGALDGHGALSAAVSGRPRWLERIEQAGSVRADRERWRQAYNAGASPLSPLVRAGMSRVADRRATPLVTQTGANVVLRLTGWCRSTIVGVRHASYHDGNLAAYLRRPDLRLDPHAAGVRRALAWERETYERTHVIFTMSEWLRSVFVEDFGQPRDKVVCVGGGSNLALPAELERAWDEPHVLFVGKDWQRKGGQELAQAWPALRAAFPEARLTVIGPATAPHDLPPDARFLGRLAPGSPALVAAYRDATTFVMASRFEPFGIALLEAMGYGLPCLTADRCAMPEIVRDGETGRVVDPNDSDAFAAALVDLADPETARRMGAAGRRRLEERYTWTATAARIVAALEEAR